MDGESKGSSTVASSGVGGDTGRHCPTGGVGSAVPVEAVAGHREGVGRVGVFDCQEYCSNAVAAIEGSCLIGVTAGVEGIGNGEASVGEG